MSAVLGETRYTATFWANLDMLGRPSTSWGHSLGLGHCSGCNGSFLLDFTHTSVGNGAGVFGVGPDVVGVGQRISGFAERPAAFVTFGDGTTASLPLNSGFWGITAGERIQSIHVGRADGSPTNQMLIVIDNLTIGSSPVIGVTIDIKPGEFPNSINVGAEGTVPVAILSTSDFDARTVDPRSVTLAGALVRMSTLTGFPTSCSTSTPPLSISAQLTPRPFWGARRWTGS